MRQNMHGNPGHYIVHRYPNFPEPARQLCINTYVVYDV
jgi:hypothetical protein